MKKKSLLALMLVLVVCMALVMVLASCGNDSSNPNSPDNDGNIKPNENDQGGDVEEHTHVWSEWELVTVPTETSVGSIKRSCECGAEEIVELPFVNDTNYNIERIEPTCTEKGKMICTVKNNFLDYTIEVELEALGHDFGDPIYEWNEDKTVCTATRICNRDTKHVEVATATVTTVVVEPTCDTLGSTTYTATFSEDWAEEQSDIVYVDVLGHDYGVTTYDWSDDKTTCTAQRICNRDPNHIDIATATVNINRVEPTCYTLGTITYTAIFNETWADMQTYTEEIPALGHDFGAPTYHWNEYHTVCQAQRVCTRDPHHVEISNATVNIETIDATCTEQGSIICTATFVDPWAETQTEITKTEALGHDFMAPTYEWSVDNSTYTATRVCNRNPNHIETAHATVTSTRVEPTCTARGSIEYVATFTESWATGQTKYVELEMKPHTYESVVTAPTCTDEGYTTHICSVCGHSYVDTYVDALGHDYGDITYTWSEDGSSCTAERVCSRGCGAKQTAYASISKEVTKVATCLEKGETTYTATFIDGWPDVQTLVVADIPALGHDWNVTYTWNDALTQCTATRVCSRDASHNIDETVAVVAEVTTPSTCTEMGVTTYTATFKSTWATQQQKTLTNVEKIPHNYEFVENVAATCTTDGYTLQRCSECGHEKQIDIIPALGHRGAPNSNYCEVCGEVIDDSVFTFDKIYNTPDSDLIIRKYFGDYANVAIPSMHDGLKVRDIGSNAFADVTSLEKVIIPDSIKNIYASAFKNCTALNDINIPNGIPVISKSVFFGCSSLQSINIPNSVEHIEDSAFQNCTKLSNIIYEDGCKLRNIYGNAFDGCTALQTFKMPSSVEWVGPDVFNGCTGLNRVETDDIGAWCGIDFVANPLAYAHNLYLNGELVTDLVIPADVTIINNSAFYACTPLTSVTALNSKLTSIGTRAFINCNQITTVNLPSSLTSLGDFGFYGCAALQSITFGENSQLSDIGNDLFKNCSALTNITIPKGVTIIGSETFENCSALTNVTIEGNSQLEIIAGRSFKNCTKLESIAIPDNVVEIYVSAFYNCEGLKNVTISDSSKLSRIYSSVFYNCKLLNNINLPASLTIIGDYAFNDCSSLTSITIPEGVTSIDQRTFYGCTALATISIPSSVNTIGKEAFDGCAALTSIIIPEGVSVIEEWTFSGCCNLVSVTLPSTINTIHSNAFQDCSALTSVVIPEGVTTLSSQVFYGCSALSSVTLPSSLTSIHGYAFRECKSLTSIIVPSNVTNIGSNAFYKCKALKNIVFEDNSQLTSIGTSSFAACNVLESITIPAGVSVIEENAFENCIGLKSVAFGMNSQLTKIGNCAFSGCSALASVDMPVSLTEIGSGAFYGCSVLASITIPAGVSVINATAFSSCTELQSVTFGDLSQLADIGQRAFYQCNSLTTIALPSTLKNIGEYAFANCTGLQSVTFGDLSQLTNIGQCSFSGCTALESMTIPSGVTAINASTFYNCIALTSIDIPSSVTTLVDGAFSNCTGLASITLSEGLTSIGKRAFTQCSALANIVIPSSVTSIGDEAFNDNSLLQSVTFGDNSQLTNIGISAFTYCSALLSINIPYGVTSIKDRTFMFCTKLANVTLPDSITSIGVDAFKSTTIVNITIPNSVTSIGMNAFTMCNELESITIPDSVTSIGDCAFSNCNALKSVILSDKVVNMGEGVFEYGYNYLKIYVTGSTQPSSWADGWNSNHQIYWFSETKPDAAPTNGNGYWYYDADGVTPKIWQI